MASIHSGYETQYAAIGGIHGKITLPGADELVFLSGYTEDQSSPKAMIPWSHWMDWVLFNQIKPRPAEAKQMLETALKQQSYTTPSNSTSNNEGVGIYEYIASNSRLSKFKKLIDEVGYGKIFTGPITIFAPVDDKFDATLSYILNVAYKPVSRIQSLRYHILNYPIEPWQLENRKIDLNTDFYHQPIRSDWTGGRKLLMNPVNPGYVPPPAGSWTNGVGQPVTARPDSWFPRIQDEVEILDYIPCANGNIYIISRPIIFADLL